MISLQGTLINKDIMAQIIAKLSLKKTNKFLSLGNHFILQNVLHYHDLVIKLSPNQ